ncbi:MAG: cation diffusion facilitator family transporter [Terriglobales bacterium]
MTSAVGPIPDSGAAAQAKQRVALYSLLATVGLLVFKIAVARHSNSLGIWAEAAHSALDLLATVLTLSSVRIAARPADANHPFGHGKFENFSAFLQTGLLLLTACGIAALALQRLLGPQGRVHLGIWAFLVMLIAMVVDWWRSRALRRAAVRYHSDALQADALNFSADLWSSFAVLTGLTLAALGARTGWTGLERADAIAAMAVAVLLAYLSWGLGRRTVGVLLDEAPVELLSQLQQCAGSIPGVVASDRLRVRRSGSRYFVDVRLAVERTLTLERARQVRDQVSDQIHRLLPDADVVVDTEPRKPFGDSIFERLKTVAFRNNLSMHDLAVYDVGGGLQVELHLEVDEHMTLKQAHDLITAIEAEMRAEVPQIQQIITHIEPELAESPSANVVDPARLVDRAQAVAAATAGVLDCHDIRVRSSDGHLALSCHCSFPDSMAVIAVHAVISGLETALKREMPELLKVTIHTEPSSDNRR